MDASREKPDDAAPIVFFDGVCGLCNRFVDFLLRRDAAGRLRYAPLQGETAAAALPAEYRDLDTVVFRDGERTLVRSAAVAAILKRLGGVWRVFGALLWVIPRPVRDFGYRLVAANRLRLFGERETCRMPTPEEAGRLLP